MIVIRNVLRPLPYGLFGTTFHVQAFVVDAAAAAGISCSNVLIKQVGL